MASLITYFKTQCPDHILRHVNNTQSNEVPQSYTVICKNILEIPKYGHKKNPNTKYKNRQIQKGLRRDYS